jgi:cysteinyl-tRNA synthetase
MDITRATSGLLTCLILFASPPADAEQIDFRKVDSWGYQLQNVQPRIVADDGFDVLVVDYSRNGQQATALTPEDVAALRKRPGQPDRIILSYLSIGEAEDYRYYWNPSWVEPNASPPARKVIGFAGSPDGKSVGVATYETPLSRRSAASPDWLAEENPEWRGNFLVKYWDPAWQAIIMGSPDAYLDRIIAAGFDGVYLDKIDANDNWEKTRPTAEREMVAFVKRIAAYGRAKRPGFKIVPQNAEELLKFKDYVATIDAIAKEDLLFGLGKKTDNEGNAPVDVAKSRRLLDKAKQAGKKVLVVEYVSDAEAIKRATKQLQGYGFVPLFAKRELDAAPSKVEAATRPSTR